MMPKIAWDPVALEVFGKAKNVIRRMRPGHKEKILYEERPVVFMIGFDAEDYDMMAGHGKKAIVVRVLAQRGKEPYETYDTVYVDMRCGPDADRGRHQTVLSALTHHFGIPVSLENAVGLERYYDRGLSWSWENVKSVKL